MSIRSITFVLAALAVAAQVAALAAPKGPITGLYRSADASEEVRITGAAPNFRVHIVVGMDGCGGGMEGPATVKAGGALLVVSDQCRVTMTETAKGWRLAEQSCGALHGDACSFDGDIARAAH